LSYPGLYTYIFPHLICIAMRLPAPPSSCSSDVSTAMTALRSSQNGLIQSLVEALKDDCADPAGGCPSRQSLLVASFGGGVAPVLASSPSAAIPLPHFPEWQSKGFPPASMRRYCCHFKVEVAPQRLSYSNNTLSRTKDAQDELYYY